LLADGFISPSPTLPYIFHSVQRATFLGSAAYGARIDFFLTPPPHFNSIRAGVADKQLVVLGKFQNSQENVKLSFYERLFFFSSFLFFPPSFFFPPPPRHRVWQRGAQCPERTVLPWLQGGRHRGIFCQASPWQKVASVPPLDGSWEQSGSG